MPTTTIDPCTDFDPKTVHLSHGSHGPTFQGETCLVEAACVATMCCTTLAEKYGKATQFGDDHPAWDAAWDAASAAAWDALRPTVELLQTSALELLDAMILVGRTDAERAA